MSSALMQVTSISRPSSSNVERSGCDALRESPSPQKTPAPPTRNPKGDITELPSTYTLEGLGNEDLLLDFSRISSGMRADNSHDVGKSRCKRMAQPIFWNQSMAAWSSSVGSGSGKQTDDRCETFGEIKWSVLRQRSRSLAPIMPTLVT